MSLPLFFVDADVLSGTLSLDEVTSRHVSQVLRMKMGDPLLLTNGAGKKATAVIHEQGKKTCGVVISSVEDTDRQAPEITIAISLTKNTGRFEWFLEKATEIGINTIVPLVCDRTEKTHFRPDRMKNILVSAMLQSRQYWLPELKDPVSFRAWVSQTKEGNKWIAHCLEEKKVSIQSATVNTVICIGPEGDFTPDEITLALQNGFRPVTLGENRLRTETAGMVAATLLRIG